MYQRHRFDDLKNGSYTHDSFEANSFWDEDVVAMCDALKSNDRVKGLVVVQSLIREVGDEALADLIQHNTTIQDVHLIRNMLTVTGVVTKFFNAVQNSRTLRRLSIDSFHMSHDDKMALVQAMSSNSSVIELNLENNGFTDAIGFANVLVSNKCLVRLNLGWNDLRDGVAVANALNTNSTLRGLCLDGNPIGDIGVAALAKMLKRNRTITGLYLEHVGMSGAGAFALAEALRYNNTLETLSVCGNRIDHEGSKALYHASELTRANTIVAEVDRVSTDVPKNMGRFEMEAFAGATDGAAGRFVSSCGDHGVLGIVLSFLIG